MARPYWSGRIQVSLVSFGVQLFTATESKASIAFHQISRSTGECVRHQKVLDSSVSAYGEAPAAAVPNDEIVKGYQYSKGQYVIIETGELDNLKVPSKHTIDASQFVGATELLPEYIESPTSYEESSYTSPTRPNSFSADSPPILKIVWKKSDRLPGTASLEDKPRADEIYK